jgi:hypothetical protein
MVPLPPSPLLQQLEVVVVELIRPSVAPGVPAAALAGAVVALVLGPPVKDLTGALLMVTPAAVAAALALLELMQSAQVLVALVVLVLLHLLQVRLFLEQAAEELLPILRLHLLAVLGVVAPAA